MKNKTNKALTRNQVLARAKNLLKSGRYYNHIGNAEPVNGRKYSFGDQVVSIDPWKQYDHKVTYMKSLRWEEGGGGYLVMDKFGRPHTTTNICFERELA